MRIDRNIGHAPRVQAIGRKLMETPLRCVDWTECKGLCQELIDVLMLPDMVLKAKDG